MIFYSPNKLICGAATKVHDDDVISLQREEEECVTACQKFKTGRISRVY